MNQLQEAIFEWVGQNCAHIEKLLQDEASSEEALRLLERYFEQLRKAVQVGNRFLEGFVPRFHEDREVVALLRESLQILEWELQQAELSRISGDRSQLAKSVSWCYLLSTSCLRLYDILMDTERCSLN